MTNEKKRLIQDIIYGQCIKNNWFTCGNNKQYEQLFNMVGDGSSGLLDACNYISDHSDNVRTGTIYAILEKELAKFK